MLPPVWCASHVVLVGKKPPRAAWDRAPGPLGRLPSSPCQPPCHRLGIGHVAGHTLTRHL